MRYSDSFILGIIQGVGEFLPISSSAHLYLYSYLLKLKYQGLFFDVMLHLGTLFAVIIYFWRDIYILVENSIKGEVKSIRFIFAVISATIPAIVAGLFLDDYAERVFRDYKIVALSLIIFSIFIYIIDRKFGKTSSEKEFNWKDGIIAGLFQSVAIVPGASRSAMSICGLMIMGYSRRESARISFFMSIPVIAGAGFFEIKKSGFFVPDLYLLTGFLSSFLVGLISIRFLLSFVKKHSFSIFVLYRILLGIVVLAV